MENNGDETKALFNELIQGKELVEQLRVHLNPSSLTGELILDKLQSSFDRAISMGKKSGSDPQIIRPNTVFLESPPRSKSESPRSDDSATNDLSKRRKTLPKWAEKVGVGSVTTSTGLEGPLEDGYSWRKYGQKDILGAKYPRGYYRCTYRKSQGCLAKKQVQRSSDPSIFDVTYQGRHTCFQVSHSIGISNLQQNHNQNQSQIQNQNQNQNQDQQVEQKPNLSQEVLLNFEAGLRIKTEDDFIGTHGASSSFSFPSTSLPMVNIKNEDNFFSPLDSNYYSTNHSQRNNIGGQAFHNFHTTTSESSDLNEILSASAPDSPIIGMDFTLDEPGELDPNFPFSSFY